MARLRSFLFSVLAGLLILTMGLVGAPVVLWSTPMTRAWQKLHNRLLFGLARRLLGIEIEVRGMPPRGDVIIAAKHQSLLDVLILYNALEEPRFVMKKELLWTPVFGLYAWRTGAVSIDRSGGKGTTAAMVEAFRGRSGQIVIYPQGTRVPPGEKRPYRKGLAVLAEALSRPVVPVATNAGLSFPKHGPRRPGRVVVEFLDPLPPDLTGAALMAEAERRIETASDALLAEGRRLQATL